MGVPTQAVGQSMTATSNLGTGEISDQRDVRLDAVTEPVTTNASEQQPLPVTNSHTVTHAENTGSFKMIIIAHDSLLFLSIFLFESVLRFKIHGQHALFSIRNNTLEQYT